MKTKRISLLGLSVLALCACAHKQPQSIKTTESASPIANISAEESAQWWYQQGQKRVKELQSQSFPAKAKNIILVIGDGMSIGTVTAARILAGQQLGKKGEEHQLSFDKFPNTALAKTYNTNLQTPDSAGTMTAMMTGVKTKAGVVSLDSRVLKGDCNSAKGSEVTTLLELAEESGMATGIVSTAKITHATPAATYAHTPSRNWEADSDIPTSERNKGCKDIAQQLLDFPYGDGIEVALGGGRENFLPKNIIDPEYKDLTGQREDQQNLMLAWEKKFKNAKAIWNLEQFNQINPKKTKHLLGLFQPSHMQYEQERPSDPSKEPSLTQMTEKALDILQHQNKPYFLMIEAGRIDHGHHAGIARKALIDTIELSNAVAKVVDKINLEDTLIIVTADHSHTFTIAGYPQRGNPILGLVKTPNDKGQMVGKLAKDAQGKPYTTLGYANGPGYVNGDKRHDLTHVDTHSLDYKQAATIPIESETHSGEDVSIYATGAGSHLVKGVIEQNVIFHIMLEALKHYRSIDENHKQ